METKRVKKLEEKEDRISDLPDPIIHDILSFLPSTEEAIRTSVLSKRWKTQWTQVPVLIFIDSKCTSYDNYLEFIDKTLDLHDCLKIEKFHIQYGYVDDKEDPQFASKFCFAIGKHVEDLRISSKDSRVNCQPYFLLDYGYILPEILFDNASLVKLSTENCWFMPSGKVNWPRLTTLNIGRCNLTHHAMGHILSGSPLLKSLKLMDCAFEKIVIASKSLKILVIQSHSLANISVLEISCGNLEELSLSSVSMNDTELFAQAIENVISSNLLLESFKLNYCRGIQQLVISSKSLKILVLGDVYNELDLEISCPWLEDLSIRVGLNVKTVKLLNLPSSLCATIIFDFGMKIYKRMIEDILNQLEHVKELIVYTYFMEAMSAMKLSDQFSPVLNIKCLTLESAHLEKHHSGIALLLGISPLIEKLVINMRTNYITMAHDNIENNYWIIKKKVFNCLESHLKTIKITRFPRTDCTHEHMLNFAQFLLNNSRVLEKMVVVLKENETTFPLQVSEILSGLPKCSQNAVIEVLYCK